MLKPKSKRHQPYTVCYFQRSRLSVYFPSKHQVAALDFPPTILNDLTVIDGEQFAKAITKMLAQYKAEPGPVLIVLAADVCFTEEIDPGGKQPVDEVVKELRSVMPFTNVFTRTVRVGKRHVAVALNREFYEPLLNVFRTAGYDVTTLVPEFILAQPLAQTGLTPEIAQLLAQQVDKLEAFDLLETLEKPKLITTSAQTPEDTRKTLILVAVFAVLTLVLVLVWWWTNRSTPPAQPVVPVVPVATPRTTMTPSPVPSPLPTDLDFTVPTATESAATGSAGLAEPATLGVWDEDSDQMVLPVRQATPQPATTSAQPLP